MFCLLDCLLVGCFFGGNVRAVLYVGAKLRHKGRVALNPTSIRYAPSSVLLVCLCASCMCGK
jgi:hypothetical protein